jgi:hypothetical protein
MNNKIKIKQLSSGTFPFGNVLISDGINGMLFYDVSGLTYNIQKGTVLPINPLSGDLFYETDINTLYYYDDIRTKWLSVEQHILSCGRISADEEISVYMKVGDSTQNSTTGFKMIRNGTIISASIQNDNILISDRNIEIRINNSIVNKVSLDILTGQSGVSVDNYNLDFNQGDLIQVVVLPGSEGSVLNNPIVNVKISFRI